MSVRRNWNDERFYQNTVCCCNFGVNVSNNPNDFVFDSNHSNKNLTDGTWKSGVTNSAPGGGASCLRMCRSRKSSREIARLRMRYKNMEMKWNQIKDGDLSEVPKDKWLTVAYKNPRAGKTYVDFGRVFIERNREYIELFMLEGFATGACLIAWVENPEPYMPYYE